MQASYFDQRTVDRLRNATAKAAELAAYLPEGWCRSPVDPARVVAAFPSLGVKDGFVLRAYLFRSGLNGNGVVWAMPTESDFPEPDACPRMVGTFLEAPRPPGAIDPMEAIDGDGTPLSYLSASLLARELPEFGALWHGCEWASHKILCADPWNGRMPRAIAEEVGALSGWTWEERRPMDWRASVTADDDSREVVFHTFTGLVQSRIVRHIDRYRAGSYAPRSRAESIGTGPGGYIY